MPKVRNEPKLTCADCNIRKCNWFTPCADCNHVLCTACFTKHICPVIQIQEQEVIVDTNKVAIKTKKKKVKEVV